MECVWCVPGCGLSRRRSHLCFKHRKVAASLPPLANMAVGMEDLAHLMVPVDVMDFLNLYEHI